MREKRVEDLARSIRKIDNLFVSFSVNTEKNFYIEDGSLKYYVTVDNKSLREQVYKALKKKV